MKRELVESDALVSVGYNRETQVLQIEFEGGRIYDYYDVPRQVHDWLLRVQNKGAYLNQIIKERYEFRDVTPAAQEVNLAAALIQSINQGD